MFIGNNYNGDCWEDLIGMIGVGVGLNFFFISWEWW